MLEEKIIRESLPDFWITPLLYGDYSGLNEDDIKSLEEWQEDHKGWWCTEIQDDSSFCIDHDANCVGVPAADCSTFVFMVTTEN